MCWNSVYFDILDHTLLHIACKNNANLHTLNIWKRFQVVIEYHVDKDVLLSFAFLSVISGDFEAFWMNVVSSETRCHDFDLVFQHSPFRCVNRSATVIYNFRKWRNTQLWKKSLYFVIVMKYVSLYRKAGAHVFPYITLVNVKAPEVTYNALVSAFSAPELDKTQYQQS